MTDVTETENSTSWKDEPMSALSLLAAVLRRRMLVILVTGIVALGVMAHGLLSGRTWTANASFLPQAPEAASTLSSIAGQFGFNVGAGDPGQTPEFYADLIRSREILSEIVLDTFEVDDTLGMFRRGIVRTTLPRLLDISGASEEAEKYAAAAWLSKHAVSASVDYETGLVRFSVTTAWPGLSEQIGSKILAHVQRFNLERRQSQAAAERRFIEGRVAEAQDDLRQSEQALQTFLQGNRGFQNSPELQFLHDRLQRQLAMRQQVYVTLVQSYEDARIAEVRNTPLLTVVERMHRPVRPDPRHLAVKVMAAVFVGVLIGVLTVFLTEYLSAQERHDESGRRDLELAWRETRSGLARFIPFRSRED